MLKLTKCRAAVIALAFFLIGSSSSPLQAEDAIETAGMAIGMTGGNTIVLPAKMVSMGLGALFGAVSFLLTGNADLTKQIWDDTTQGPYLITPEVAKKAVGERPELQGTK